MQTFSRLTWMLAVAAWCGSVQAAEPVRGCAAKRQAIEQELAHARAAGNIPRQQGLERALAAAATCDDGQLRQEREQAVRKAEAKVREREQDLAKETAQGRAKDIAKARRKLDEARHDLDEARLERER